MIITGRQLRAACALAGIDQIELAKRAKVSVGTVRKMESYNDAMVVCSTLTLDKVTKALEKSGVIFVERGVQMIQAVSVKFSSPEPERKMIRVRVSEAKGK